MESTGTLSSRQPVNASAMYLPMATVLGVWLAILTTHRETVAKMVSIWDSSGNYGHCWVVLPIAVWMVWTRRRAIDWTAARPFTAAVPAVAIAGAAWLIGELTSVGSVQQFALVFMLQLSILAVLGVSLSRALIYPIAFLIFLVPTGDFMTPWLIERTADFTVWALKLTGVPVFREGNDLTIPSGRWSVVEACSGTRYLVASMMAGTAFAFLQFQSSYKRLVFLGVSIVVPLVANWLRAYLIVLIGHLTSNEYATGADHLVYGAFLFGVIIFVLFAIGNRFRDPEPQPSFPAAAAGATRRGVAGFATVGALAAVAGMVWIPVTTVLHDRLSSDDVRLREIDAPAGWQQTIDARSTWLPEFLGARAELRQSFTREGRSIHVAVAYFAKQSDGSELITQSHAFAFGNDHWRSMKRRVIVTESGPVRAATLQGASAKAAVRTWYWMEGRQVVSEYVVKALTAVDVLVRGRDDSAMVVVYTEQLDAAQDSSAIDEFVSAIAPRINNMLASARR